MLEIEDAAGSLPVFGIGRHGEAVMESFFEITVIREKKQ